MLAVGTPGVAPAAPPPWVLQPVAVATPSAVNQLAPPSARAPSVTSMLAQVWSSDGGGQGGRLLDEALTSLGEAYVEGDRVVWEVPENLDPLYRDYLLVSVDQLNRLIEAGVMQIDEDGTLHAAATEVPETGPTTS